MRKRANKNKEPITNFMRHNKYLSTKRDEYVKFKKKMRRLSLTSKISIEKSLRAQLFDEGI